MESEFGIGSGILHTWKQTWIEKKTVSSVIETALNLW
jgi:hypothetical protein